MKYTLVSDEELDVAPDLYATVVGGIWDLFAVFGIVCAIVGLGVLAGVFYG